MCLSRQHCSTPRRSSGKCLSPTVFWKCTWLFYQLDTKHTYHFFGMVELIYSFFQGQVFLLDSNFRINNFVKNWFEVGVLFLRIIHIKTEYSQSSDSPQCPESCFRKMATCHRSCDSSHSTCPAFLWCWKSLLLRLVSWRKTQYITKSSKPFRLTENVLARWGKESVEDLSGSSEI